LGPAFETLCAECRTYLSSSLGQATHSGEWLASMRSGSVWPTTQGTVLSLRALLSLSSLQSSVSNPLPVTVTANGAQVGSGLASPDSSYTLQVDGADIPLPHTEIEVELSLGLDTAGNQVAMPYSVSVAWSSSARGTPLDQPDQPKRAATNTSFAFDVSLASSRVSQGSRSHIRVHLGSTTSGLDLHMPVAIIGIPGGAELDVPALDELVEADRISAWEVQASGSELVLYWISLPQHHEDGFVDIAFTAGVPGSYVGRASRAWEYYASLPPHWLPGLHLEIEE